MTKSLPVSFAAAEQKLRELEAVGYAREQVQKIRDEKINWFGLPLSWFDKLNSRAAVRQWMKTMARQPSGLSLLDLVNLARAGWDLAEEAARELYVEYKHAAAPVPVVLEAYIVELADPRRVARRPRGKKKSDNLLRNLAIVALVLDVCWKFGLAPTRSQSGRRERLAGCHVVARALYDEGLSIGEATVVGVWQRLGARAFAGGLQGAPYPF